MPATSTLIRTACALVSLSLFGADCRELHQWLPTYNIPRPVKIITWTNWVGYNDRAPAWVSKNAPNCVVEQPFGEFDGIAVKDPDLDISGADAVVFDASAMDLVKAPMPREKPAGQLWIAFCSEAWSHNCRPMQDEEFISRMDGVASYDNRSAFPALFTPPAEDQLRRAPPQSKVEPSELDTGKPLVTYYSGDCKRASREQWVTSMIEALQERDVGVRAYGKCPEAYRTPLEPTCLGNGLASYSSEGDDITEGDPDEALLPPASDDSIFDSAYYKWVNRCGALPFALVAENTDDVPGYVTEKLWVALLNGAVPIYAGPEEAKDLLPPGSAIFASDYGSPEDLADAVVEAQQNLEQFHAWRTLPIDQWGGWQEAQRLSSFTLMPRICESIANGGPAQSGIDMSWRPPRMEMTRSFLEMSRLDIRWRADDLSSHH